MTQFSCKLSCNPKCHFSEHRAMALVCKLEKYMMQLVQIMHKVTELTDEYQKKVQKSEVTVQAYTETGNQKG